MRFLKGWILIYILTILMVAGIAVGKQIGWKPLWGLVQVDGGHANSAGIVHTYRMDGTFGLDLDLSNSNALADADIYVKGSLYPDGPWRFMGTSMSDALYVENITPAGGPEWDGKYFIPVPAALRLAPSPYLMFYITNTAAVTKYLTITGRVSHKEVD